MLVDIAQKWVDWLGWRAFFHGLFYASLVANVAVSVTRLFYRTGLLALCLTPDLEGGVISLGVSFS